MTITYIDPPGRLANTREPIDFTATLPVTSITVEYNPALGNGVRECVFDGTEVDGSGGDFSYAFRASTRSGTGPWSWTIRPTGRWPADFRLRVKELSAGGIPSWQLVYAVDFTAQTPQTFGTAGAHVIDGKTWYYKTGGVSLLDMEPQLSATKGLAWGVAAGYGAAVGDYNASPGAQPLECPHWFLPFTQLDEYNAAVPICVRARIDEDGALAPGSGGGAVGIVDCTNDAIAHSGANRSKDAFAHRFGNTNQFGYKIGDQGPTTAAASLGANGIGVFSAPQAAGSHFVASSLGSSWTGFPATPSDMDFGPARLRADTVLPRTNPGVMLHLYASGQPNTLLGIKGIEVWQYK